MRLLLFLGCLIDIIDTLLLLTYCTVPGPHLLQAQERAVIIDSNIIVVASQLPDRTAELNPKAGSDICFHPLPGKPMHLTAPGEAHIAQNLIQPNLIHPSLTAGPNNEYSTLEVVVVIQLRFALLRLWFQRSTAHAARWCVGTSLVSKNTPQSLRRHHLRTISADERKKVTQIVQ